MKKALLFAALVSFAAASEAQTATFTQTATVQTETDEQAEVRMAEKGTDAARVAVEMANLTIALDDLAETTRLEVEG